MVWDPVEVWDDIKEMFDKANPTDPEEAETEEAPLLNGHALQPELGDENFELVVRSKPSEGEGIFTEKRVCLKDVDEADRVVAETI